MDSDGIDLSDLEMSLPVNEVAVLNCGPLKIVMTSDPISINQDFQDTHTRYEFLLPLIHIPHFFIDKKKLDLRPGQLILINPGQKHGLSKPVKKASFIAVLYQADYMDSLFKNIIGTNAEGFSNELGLLQSDVQTILTSLIQEYKENRPGRTLLIDHLREHLAILLIRHYGQDRQSLLSLYPQPLTESQLRFQPVIEFMHENLSDKLNIDQMAELTQMNRFHFIRAFKQAFDHSPYDFLTELRITQAKRLLVQTKISANEIGRQCGFFSASRFSAAFRQNSGLTPSAYRNFQSHDNPVLDKLSDPVRLAMKANLNQY